MFYDSATSLHNAAVALFQQVQGSQTALSGCSGMSGSYSEAKAWAKTYDDQSWQALFAAQTLAQTMEDYAGALRVIGFNHELADWNANVSDNKGPAPTLPATPDPAVSACDVPPPSAGGPGNGLSDVVGLAEKVGITIPDGDTDKLGAVGDAWTKLHDAKSVSGLSDEIGRIYDAVNTVKSPEVWTILSDLKGMQDAASTLATGFSALADACHGHQKDLADLRTKLEDQLEDLAKELLEQEAINLAVGAVASMVTFGIGAVVAAARTAELVEKFAKPIKDLVQVWKDARAAKKDLDGAETLAQAARKQQQLQQRIDKAAAQAKKNAEKAAKDAADGVKSQSLTYDDVVTLNRGPTDRNGRDLIKAIREGKLTPEQEQDIAAYNSALDKLPNYEGDVVRQTNLSPEQLDKYVKGQPYTEDSYTCTSHNPAGTGGGLNAPSSNVEYQIVSKTGKDISQYGGTKDEIQFKDHTNFFVQDKYWDPQKQMTIIVMDEI
ncbi:hypothetical protein EBN03_07400 [Nocardia stercoris]|uniref:Uncharacterized protein n=1 Tax=Nocardia stercoris TaxID=2483361 RepID=A0A3M2L9H9_9NOCA|nr:hypothetical protein EBN03_07400 [Nocardia stercoris]